MKTSRKFANPLFVIAAALTLSGCGPHINFEVRTRGGLSAFFRDDGMASAALCKKQVPDHFYQEFARFNGNTVRVVLPYGVACLETPDQRLLRTFTNRGGSGPLFRFNEGRWFWIFADNRFEEIPNGKDPVKWQPS